MVPAVSNGISPVPPYSGYPPNKQPSCTGFSPSMIGLPMPFQSIVFLLCRSYNPEHAVTYSVWAPPLSLATTHGIIVIFSSYGYLDVSVPHVRFSFEIVLRLGCPIRISTDQLALANPRSFSQLITSFLASESLGIPRAPLFTYFYSRPHSHVNHCYSLYFNMSMNFYPPIGNICEVCKAPE